MSNILKTGLHRSKKNVGGSIGVIVMHRRLKYIDFYNCKWMVAEWFPPKSSFSCDNSYKVKFSLVLGAGMRSRNRVNLIFISLQTLHLFNPWGMPFLGGSCIKDAREQGRNRTCYLWKKSEIRENTFWNYRKENIFPEGKKISNPKINGFFSLIKVFFPSLRLHHCIANEREGWNVPASVMSTLPLQENQNAFCERGLVLT